VRVLERLHLTEADLDGLDFLLDHERIRFDSPARPGPAEEVLESIEHRPP
jgi:hypothetical protein